MSEAVTGEVFAGSALPGAIEGGGLASGGRSVWLRRAEAALVLLVLPVALALAVAQVVGASTAAGSRHRSGAGAAAPVPVLVVDGGGGPAGVERVLAKLREAGIVARVALPTVDPTDATEVVASGSQDVQVAARVQRVLGVGTLASHEKLHYGTGVTVVVGKDVLER